MQCKRCGSTLITSPEFAEGEWFIRCLDCGVKNLVTAGVEVVGWKYS